MIRVLIISVALLIALPLLAPLLSETFDLPRFAFVIALYLHLAWTAYRTGAEDLVAARITARKWFFVAVALIGLGVTAAEISYRGEATPGTLLLLQAAASWESSVAPGGTFRNYGQDYDVANFGSPICCPDAPFTIPRRADA